MAKLGAEKAPTLETFNAIIESHKAGKEVARMSATTNTVKRKYDKGEGWIKVGSYDAKLQIQLLN